jgi:hypothetical protein
MSIPTNVEETHHFDAAAVKKFYPALAAPAPTLFYWVPRQFFKTRKI